MGTSTLQRKNKPGKFLAIPQISPSNPTMDAISENLEQLTGMRGSGGKKAVLWEDMNSLGFAKMNKNGVPSSTLPDNSGTGSGGNTNVVEPPTKPLNVKGYGGFGIITLTWDYPTYKGHAYANVYQSDTDNFSTAVQVGTATGDIFSFPQANATAKFYWLRFVNANDDIGPLNATAGIQISTQSEDFLKDLIKSELGEIDFVDHDSLVDFAHVDLLDRLDVLLAESALENSTTIDEQISEAKVDTATLRATVKNEYYTIVKSNEVMAAAIQTVKSEIEDPNGTSLGATVKNNYVTNVTFNQAQAQLKQKLQSNIDSVSSTLTNDYYTKTKTDEAISQATTTLNSAIESAKDEANQSINAVSSNLTNNYLTKTETNQAISQASLHLSSEISTAKSEAISAAASDATSKANGAISAAASDATKKVNVVSSNLTNNYLTKTQTNHAITQATQTLESSINGVSSTVTSLSKTVADNEKGYEALWGVKASA
ncbi:hypothetical protein, partial [Vibrio sp. ER1A]|uniref:hypothetical protein n=1 Tax=Vibrio sp. ER1A TaxID=1517681 RepID=UPI0004DD70A9